MAECGRCACISSEKKPQDCDVFSFVVMGKCKMDKINPQTNINIYYVWLGSRRGIVCRLVDRFK